MTATITEAVTVPRVNASQVSTAPSAMRTAIRQLNAPARSEPARHQLVGARVIGRPWHGRMSDQDSGHRTRKCMLETWLQRGSHRPRKRRLRPWAGVAAMAASIGGVIYSAAFLGGVVLELNPELGIRVASAALMVGGLLSTVVLVAVYQRIGGGSMALIGLVFALMGALGSIVHGGYDLALALNPPASDPLTEAGLPSPVDPRGLLTFGLAGLGLLILALRARATGALTVPTATFGIVLGILLIIVYLGRLIILTPTSPLVAVPAGLAGVIVGPFFYFAVGLELRRR